MSNRTYVSIDKDKGINVNGPPSTMMLMHWRTLRMMVERARFARKHNMVYGAITEDEITVLEGMCGSVIESAQKAANQEATDDEESRREMVAAARRVDAARKPTAATPAKRRSERRGEPR